MASYIGHLSFSTVLGAAYGSFGSLYLHLDWGPVFLGAGLTAVGGLLPDVDSDSGVPVRELFGLGAIILPLLVLRRLESQGLSMEQIMVLLAAAFLIIRYGISAVFKKYTVHRGIYHSIPAMLIVGMGVFLVYQSPDVNLRLYFAGGTMLGFLSHLILDELCSVDFMGAKVTLNKYAGSALKFFSPSWPVTLGAYAILGSLVWLAVRQYDPSNPGWRQLREHTSKISALFKRPIDD
jgi:membrane-bound metal-dependent hydrolase YbcI (DUF457 family)